MTRGAGPFGWALALATALHLGLILGIAIQPPDVRPSEGGRETLEILLVRAAEPSPEPPSASALAQIDHLGAGGDAAADAEVPVSDPEGAIDTSVEVEFEAPPEPLFEDPPILEPPIETRPAPIDVARIFDSRGAEIARLTERARERSNAYANRPRRKAISASTTEYKYASYLDDWRRKVEQIGNLNYPEVAKQRQLYGNLILHVAVRADGQVETIRVLRSSGFAELDEAAVRIVELAAPFAPFPPAIRAETDVLDITRTWQFLHGHRLGWGQ
ncbi:TonB family protein [Thioalkalicoccus limnaeus]|uniref:TonB family protein n=1 Tax=Thioalkalicoccus limnaeus TaxID=120681 RepID=A0ABV4BGF7_9GAMM